MGERCIEGREVTELAKPPKLDRNHWPFTDCFVPVAWWELVELVLAGCPDKALMAYRKDLITSNVKEGKRKRLTASQADSAIKGAKGVIATGPYKPGQRTKQRPEEPESLALRVARAHWYFDNRMEVVFACPRSKEPLAPEVEELISVAAGRMTWLEFTEDAVYRCQGPEDGGKGSWSDDGSEFYYDD